MTKLEKKLIELGYQQDGEFTKNIYFKYINNFYIYINSCNLKNYGVERPKMLYSKQKDIDNLQQAFDIMKKDLEVLRSVKEA